MDLNLLEPFKHPIFAKHQLEVDILRLDRIDPMISGNKWFKLQHLLHRPSKRTRILSFGGAYSNHLHALARFGQQNGIPTIGVVRGELRSTPTLEDCQKWGMQLYPLGREQYRDIRADDETSLGGDLRRELRARFGDFYLLPEGGATREAIAGCGAIWGYVPEDYRPSRVLVSVGTGATLTGLIAKAPPGIQVDGVAAIGDAGYLVQVVSTLLYGRELEEGVRWSLNSALPLRFAKLNGELAALWYRAEEAGVELDPVYTLRMLHYLLRNILAGNYRKGERILLIHTGGLQGLRGQRENLSRLASAHCGPMPL